MLYAIAMGHIIMRMADCCSGTLDDRVSCGGRSRGAGRYDWSWRLPRQVMN